MNVAGLMQPRRLLVIDFVSALLAGIIYLSLFDWIIDFLALPSWIARIQLYANFAYGSYGVCLFVTRSRHRYLFKFLVIMNVAYAFFCFALSSRLALNDSYRAAFLLLTEGLIVGTLAALEKNLWHRASIERSQNATN